MPIEAIRRALVGMDRDYCTLSQLRYDQLRLDHDYQEKLSEAKFLERPFAYEFYHQFRSLIEDGEVDFGGPVIQVEVSKTYQRCFERGKIPDFIIHVPNTDLNLAVIEFKLASNTSTVVADFDKLVRFAETPHLQYQNLVEVILGDGRSLASAKERVNGLGRGSGEDITIIWFDTDQWSASESSIKF